MINCTINEKVELAIRILLFILSVSFGMFVLLVGTRSAFAITLKKETVIEGQYIRLGDVFSEVENADYVLGPAPAPGEDVILSARDLRQVAHALGLDWSPASNTDQAVLHSSATIISREQVATLIEGKLSETVGNSSFDVLYTTPARDIVLPGDKEASLKLSSFQFDPVTTSFDAVVVAPDDENPVSRITVSGRLEKMVSVPVLRHTLHREDIIAASDLDWVEIPEPRLTNDLLTREEDIIGKSPRRTFPAGKPFADNDLELPKLIGRGDAITIVFQTGKITLTTKGKALQDGSKGDLVRVANLDSNKTLQGVVSGDHEVTIR